MATSPPRCGPACPPPAYSLRWTRRPPARGRRVLGEPAHRRGSCNERRRPDRGGLRLPAGGSHPSEHSVAAISNQMLAILIRHNTSMQRETTNGEMSSSHVDRARHRRGVRRPGGRHGPSQEVATLEEVPAVVAAAETGGPVGDRPHRTRRRRSRPGVTDPNWARPSGADLDRRARAAGGGGARPGLRPRSRPQDFRLYGFAEHGVTTIVLGEQCRAPSAGGAADGTFRPQRQVRPRVARRG